MRKFSATLDELCANNLTDSAPTLEQRSKKLELIITYEPQRSSVKPSVSVWPRGSSTSLHNFHLSFVM
jgi:hypothetical protein